MIVGLRTTFERHIEDRMHRLPLQFAEAGQPQPLCGIYLDPADVKRQKIERISPAVVCAVCVERARRYYEACFFVTFDRVQRARLLEALTWDLKQVRA